MNKMRQNFRQFQFYFGLSLLLMKETARAKLNLNTWISLVGLTLGVASLVVSMAVVSGFEKTLKDNIISSSGDLQIIRLGGFREAPDLFFDRVRKIAPVQGGFSFARVEAVMAHQGQTQGVFLQGIQPDQVLKTLPMEKRLVEGRFDLPSETGVISSVIGKGLAQKYHLSVGSQYSLVFPLMNEIDPNIFKRKLAQFKVEGIVDLGTFEYNQRFIFLPQKSLQQLAELGTRYSGIILKIVDSDQARDVGKKLQRELGSEFRILDWRELNEVLFEAIEVERPIIFLIIFVIVIAAAFNVTISLYVNVTKKSFQISLLRALGMSLSQIRKIFSLQGLIFGMFGTAAGFLLGWIFCLGFTFLESQFGLIPGSVYKIDQIHISFRGIDLIQILLATLLICWLATLFPSRKATEISPIEGLKA